MYLVIDRELSRFKSDSDDRELTKMKHVSSGFPGHFFRSSQSLDSSLHDSQTPTEFWQIAAVRWTLAPPVPASDETWTIVARGLGVARVHRTRPTLETPSDTLGTFCGAPSFSGKNSEKIQSNEEKKVHPAETHIPRASNKSVHRNEPFVWEQEPHAGAQVLGALAPYTMYRDWNVTARRDPCLCCRRSIRERHASSRALSLSSCLVFS